MSARAKVIADAVAADLAAGFTASELSPSATPVAEWAPYRAATQLDSLAVIVFPFRRSGKLENRAGKQYDYTIGIFVARAAAANETNDQLANSLAPLVENIADRLLGKQLDGATCLELDDEPYIDHEKLRTSRIFEAVLSLTFRESIH